MDARKRVDFFSDHLGHRRVKSGFIYDYDIEGNIRMILHFYPDTRHIAFISDNSYGGVAMQALVREEMKKFPGLDLYYWTGVPIRFIALWISFTICRSIRRRW